METVASRRLIPLVVAAAVVGGIQQPAAATHPAWLYNCTITHSTQYVRTRCTSGGVGEQRAKGWWFNGVDYAITFGAWVDEDVYSWAYNPSPATRVYAGGTYEQRS